MKARTLKPLPEPVVTLPSKVRELNAQLGEGDESQAVELPGSAWAELVRLAEAAVRPVRFAADFREELAELRDLKTGLEAVLRLNVPTGTKTILDAARELRRSLEHLEQLEEFRLDLEHLLNVSTPHPLGELLNIVRAQRETLAGVSLARADNTAPAHVVLEAAGRRAHEVLAGVPRADNPAPCCGSVNTTFTSSGDCQACGAYVAVYDRRPRESSTGERFEPVPPPKKKRERKAKSPEQVIAAQAEAEAVTCESCGDDGHRAKDCYFNLDKPGAEAKATPRPPGRRTRKFPLGTGLTERCTKCGAELGEHAGTKCPPPKPAQVTLDDAIGGAP